MHADQFSRSSCGSMAAAQGRDGRPHGVGPQVPPTTANRKPMVRRLLACKGQACSEAISAQTARAMHPLTSRRAAAAAARSMRTTTRRRRCCWRASATSTTSTGWTPRCSSSGSTGAGARRGRGAAQAGARGDGGAPARPAGRPAPLLSLLPRAPRRFYLVVDRVVEQHKVYKVGAARAARRGGAGTALHAGGHATCAGAPGAQRPPGRG